MISSREAWTSPTGCSRHDPSFASRSVRTMPCAALAVSPQRSVSSTSANEPSSSGGWRTKTRACERRRRPPSLPTPPRPRSPATGLLAGMDRGAVGTAELEIKYAGYFAREREQADRMRRLGDFRLGSAIPYLEFQSLSVEARQKLAATAPATMAQAASIPGVNSSDLQNLIIELEKRRRLAGAIPAL